MSFRATSFNYLHQPHSEHDMRANLDRDLKVAYSQLQTADVTVVKAPTFGGSFALQGGQVSVSNGALTGFDTGLTSITSVVVSLNGGQGVPLNLWTTANPSKGVNQAGRIDVFVWQPTSSGNNTPILASGTFLVFWIAIGSAATTT